MRIDKDDVLAAAQGRWLEILPALDPNLAQAVDKWRPGKAAHVSCPVHGGTNGFRLFRDVRETGGGICNTCGGFKTGLTLLMWSKGIPFKEALNEIANYLGMDEQPKRPAFKPKIVFRELPTQPAKVASTAPVQQEVSHDRIDFDSVEVDSSSPYLAGKALAAATETLQEEPLVSAQHPESGQPEPQEEQTDVGANCDDSTIDAQEPLEPVTPRPAKPVANVVHGVFRGASIEQTWREAGPLMTVGSKPALKYLQKRGLVMRGDAISRGDNLRFHPRLKYFDEDEGESFHPAILSAIRDLNGEIISLHRTYLKPSGLKAAVASPKKIMAVPDGKTITGCAIQLGGMPKDGVLGVAEGLETALSAMRVSGVPTWAAVNANNLEKIQIPPSVSVVLIWADKDKSLRGQTAAAELQSRLDKMGIFSLILLPSQPLRGKSVDWNDVLVKQGPSSFPNLIHQLAMAMQ